jgi:hypothetical protein
MDQRHELIQGALVPLAPGLEQFRDLVSWERHAGVCDIGVELKLLGGLPSSPRSGR